MTSVEKAREWVRWAAANNIDGVLVGVTVDPNTKLMEQEREFYDKDKERYTFDKTERTREEIVAALRTLSLPRFVLDGEVVALDERGRVLAKRWTARLPESYKAAVSPASAADDIAAFDAASPALVASHVDHRREVPVDACTRGFERRAAAIEASNSHVIPPPKQNPFIPKRAASAFSCVP